MRSLQEISDDYWEVYAEYDVYTKETHPQKIRDFRQRLHVLFEEFDLVKEKIGLPNASLHDTNPY